MIYQTIINGSESARKALLADIIYYCKLTSIVGVDGVTSFLLLKDITNSCKHMEIKSNYWQEFFSAIAESWKMLKTSNVFSSFIVC